MVLYRAEHGPANRTDKGWSEGFADVVIGYMSLLHRYDTVQIYAYEAFLHWRRNDRGGSEISNCGLFLVFAINHLFKSVLTERAMPWRLIYAILVGGDQVVTAFVLSRTMDMGVSP